VPFDTLGAIIQAGAVGIAVLALLVLYQIVRLGARLIDNHLSHISEALGSLGEKLDTLISLGRRD
jgi:hypothetical protein